MGTSIATPSNGFFHNLFGPPFEPTEFPPTKDCFDYAAGYVDTNGSWDFFRIINQGLDYLKHIPSLSQAGKDLIGRVGMVVDTAGIGLSIPQIIPDFNALRHSVKKLIAAQDLPYNDPLRERKITQAAKRTFLDGMNAANNLSQAALFLDKVKIFLFETRHLHILDGIYNITSGILDTAELIGECFKLNHYSSIEGQPRTEIEKTQLSEKKCLSWMTVIKDVASIALACLALIGIIFGIVTQGIMFITVTGLVLSTVWLSLKITTYFFEKIVIGAHHHLPVTRVPV